MQVAKVSPKYQATIPQEIRRFLGVESGDTVGFDIKNDKVVLRKLEPIDLEYYKALENSMTEWSSTEDEKTFKDW